jgi:NADH-quinone oxidoreductase subunit L
METQLIAETKLVLPAMLVPLFPLLGFFITALLGKQLKHAAGWIATLAIAASFVCSLQLFFGFNQNPIEFDLFNWISVSSTKISMGFLIDQLTIVMLLVINGIGSLIHLYSIGYMHHDEGFARFFSYLNLFVFFMLMLVMGNNYLVMFIGWEGVGLCSYLLIGFWYKNQNYNDAAKKAFVMNRIGDLGFLLAIFFMLFYLGSLNFSEVMHAATILPVGGSLITAITLLLFVGATGKSAQLPLYTWLPDAMAGPTPVSALIHAATMVTAGIYMVCRSSLLFAMAPLTLDIILIVGVATSILAALIGIKQNDIKKVLAYSTVSQLGLMFTALGVGAFSSGMFHVVTHAFFKALLFLGAGSVIHAMGGEQDMRKMGGLKSTIKITFITMLIGTIAISGLPPFSGFFSKDEILANLFEHNLTAWLLMSISAMITVFYMFRLLYLTFYNDFRGTAEQKEQIHESPLTMTLPLIILAIFSAIGGFIGLPPVLSHNHLFSNYLNPVFEQATATLETSAHNLSHSTEWILIAVAVTAAVISLLYARSLYIVKKQLPEADDATTGIAKWTANKFYVDELYEIILVKPITILSDILLVLIDKLIIDLVVNAIAAITKTVGGALRYIQTGNTGVYVFVMVISMIVLLAIQLVI